MRDSNASSLEPFTRVPRVAYFSMEIAIENDIPAYAGGLGILAGDVLRFAGDMNLPMIGLTLVSERRLLPPGDRRRRKAARICRSAGARPRDSALSRRSSSASRAERLLRAAGFFSAASIPADRRARWEN